jgi:hypothetical protein
MRFLVGLALAGLLVASTGIAEPQYAEPIGPAPVEEPEPEACGECEAEWDDPIAWGGDSPPWFEDPASVDCGDRPACWEALGLKVTGEPCDDRQECQTAIRENEAAVAAK